MPDIATLVLAVDSRQVDQGGKALDRLTDSGGRAETATGKLTTAAGILGKALTVAAVGAGVTASGILTAARAAIDAADAMNDLHLKTGLSFKSLAQFDLLARQSGTSMEGMAESVKYLQRYMVEHGDNLRAIGVTSTDSATALGQFADVISSLEDPALRTSLAMEVLGRSGAQMLPMLLNGREGFDAAARASEEYGKMLTLVAPMADQFNDGLETLSTSVKTAALSVVAQFLPAVNEMVTTMAEAATESDILSAALVGLGRGGTILQALAVLVNNLGFVFRVLANDSVATLTAMGYAMTLQFDMAKKTMQQAAAYAASQRAELDKIDAQILGLAATQKATSAAAVAGDTAAAKAAAARAKALDDLVRKMLAGTKATKDSKAATDQVTAAEWAMEESAHATRTALELQAEAREYDIAAQDRQMAATDAYIDRLNAWESSQDSAKDSLERQIRSVEESTLALTLNADQLREHNTQLALESSGLDRASEAWSAYEQRLRTAYAQLQEAQSQKAATDEMADMWKSAENAAHQFFSGILSGGKDAWSRLKDSAEALFFDWLYSMTAKKWIVSIGASMSGTAGAGQAAGTVANAATGGLNLGSALSGLAALPTEIGMMAGGIAEMAGASSAMAGSIGSFVAAALPWVAGIGAVLGLVNAFSTGGTPHQGTSMQFGIGGDTSTLGRADLGGQLPNWLADMGDSSPFADAVEQLGISMVQQLNADMASLGGTLGADFALQFGFAAEREAETASGGFARVMVGGETVLELYDRYAKDGAKGMEQFAADVLPRVRLAAIQMADGLSPALDAMADSLDPATASVGDINKLLQQIGESGAALNLQATFADLGLTLGATDEQVIATGTALADLAGGFDALQSGLSSYYSAFYSTEEQLGILRGNLADSFDALGLAMPTTKDGFRSLIDSLDLTTEAGRTAYTTLISLAPAFAQMADATATAADADAESAAQQAATNASALDLSRTMGDLGLSLGGTDDAAIAAGIALADLAGGFDTLSGSISTYYRDFYSEAERVGITTAGLVADFAALGVQMPETRDDFRALVDSIDLTTESGQQMFATLMQIAPAFASIVPAVEDLTPATDDLADAAGGAAQSIANLNAELNRTADQFATQFQAYHNLAEIISGGDAGGTLTQEISFAQSEIQRLKELIKRTYEIGAPGYGLEAKKLETELALYKSTVADLRSRLAFFNGAEAQFPGFGDELLDLEIWYDEQMAIVGNNQAAMLALEQAYQIKRAEILATGTESGLDTLRGQLDDWLDKIVGGSLSPLTDQAKLELASKQFQEQYKLAVMGDEEALGSITQYAESLLAAQEAVTGHGGAFSAVWSDTLDKIKGLATATPQTGPIPVPGLQPLGTSSATVTGAAPASSGDIRTVADRLATLEQTMGRLLERLAASTDKNGVAIVTAITTTGTAQTRAVLTAADIGVKA